MNRIPGEISRAARVSVSHEAVLVLSDGTEHHVKITDVSSGGFHLLTPHTVPIETPIRVVQFAAGMF